MLKFLLILALILYVIYRVGGFFFRVLFAKTIYEQARASQQRQQQARYSRPAPNGNVKIDYVPDKQQGKKGDNRAGEYIDFEEVK